MSKKMMLLALAAVSAAMFALPAVASAGVWHAEPSTAATAFTTNTTGHGNTLLVTPNRTTTCAGNATEPSSTGTGQFDIGGTTGKISLTFYGCTSAGTACTTPGQASGVIVTSPNLVFHNILLEAGPPKIPGVKITGVGASTQLAHYTCGFGLVTVNVTGTVVGEVEQACSTKGKVFSLKFEAPGGIQKWMQETTTGTNTDLTATVNGTAETGGQTGTGTVNLGANERTITCT
ncbi:MAG: hypothetical protein QOF06_290 [Solirubrobacterales bacterium]|jgi:hypothetical protein|nr:hypothetical protein [Solirubrobacterales bacterium]